MENTVLNILFYGFALLVVFSAVMVVASRNPVHSVLFLIFSFFNAAGLLVLLGAEYIAMTLVIVYVGAVAVLFLFVVMMMDIDFAKWREGFTKQLPIGLTIAVVLFIQLGSIFYASILSEVKIPEARQESAETNLTNAEQIGLVLYTDYAYSFLLSGFVLLVAMIGAIVLTMRHREAVKKQSIAKQLARKREEGVEMLDVKPGEGVSL